MDGNILSTSGKNIMQTLLEDALQSNEESVTKWKEYKKDLENVKINMKNYSEKLSVPIMIPLCSKAMIPGQLVHTNEVLISLGDSWFSKVSTKNALENCDRRIKFCSEMIEKYDREKNILDSRLNIPTTDTGQEIIEPYNEEEMRKWREEHREKEKKYHKEKKNNKSEGFSVEEEELWKKLDELELQEELEDQILLNNDEDEEEEEEEEAAEEEENDDEVLSNDPENDRTNPSDLDDSDDDVVLIQNVPKLLDSREKNVISIYHSSIESTPSSNKLSSQLYETPSCIYQDYLNNLKKKDKKKKERRKVQFNDEDDQVHSYYYNKDNDKNSITNDMPDSTSDMKSIPSTSSNVAMNSDIENDTCYDQDLVLKNITESSVSSVEEIPKRPVSRFKASRKS